MRGLGSRARWFAALPVALSSAIAVPAGPGSFTPGGPYRSVHHALVVGFMHRAPEVATVTRFSPARRALGRGFVPLGAPPPRILSPVNGLARTLPASGGIVALQVEALHATTCSLDVVTDGGLTVTPSYRSGCTGSDDLVVGANHRQEPATLVVAISAHRGALLAVRHVVVRVAAAASSASDVASFGGTLSDNWSGYLVPSSTTVTDAAGDFAVPSVDCASAPKGAGVSFWVGTGGSGGGEALLQTGITESCAGANPRVRAWWEEVPSHPDNAHFFASFPIRIGDHLHAEVFRGASGRWETLLQDLTTGRRAVMVTGEGWGVATSNTAPVLLQHHRAPAHFSGATSAEWITEDYVDASDSSLVPLLDFGAVMFSHVRAGPAIRLALGDAVAIEQSGSLCARPSPLVGDRFFVREPGGR